MFSLKVQQEGTSGSQGEVVGVQGTLNFVAPDAQVQLKQKCRHKTQNAARVWRSLRWQWNTCGSQPWRQVVGHMKVSLCPNSSQETVKPTEPPPNPVLPPELQPKTSHFPSPHLHSCRLLWSICKKIEKSCTCKEKNSNKILTETHLRTKFCCLSKCLKMFFMNILQSLGLSCHLRNLEMCLRQTWSMKKAKGLTQYCLLTWQKG